MTKISPVENIVGETILSNLYSQSAYKDTSECELSSHCGGNKNETAKLMKTYRRNILEDKIYTIVNTDCTKYKRLRGFYRWPVSAAERNFPIAFSLLFYKELGQVEYLLKAIHQPQNLYCLHVDADSK